MINESSYASDVADELSLTSSAHAEDVTGAVDLTSAAYGEDVAEAINEQPSSEYDLRVCQYNIGHFNMGMTDGNSCYIGKSNTTTQAYPQFFDYATQLQRWKSRISGIGADIIGLPEYNENFGYNSGTLVSTPNSGIFDGYNLSVGAKASIGWWQNALASKYAMSNAQDVDLGSTTSNKAYVRVAEITLKGKTVKIGVTHLNWNNNLGALTDPNYTTNATASRNSRQKEIKELVKLMNQWLEDYDHVILLGDFNTEGPVYGPNVSYDPAVRDYEAGLEEFAPFIDGFTENGTTYQGGFTLANYDANGHRLLTCSATNSRPDLSNRPQYPYCYLDNIIVKGFTMSNVRVIDDGTITDHCAVVCDLTMIEEGGES